MTRVPPTTTNTTLSDSASSSESNTQRVADVLGVTERAAGLLLRLEALRSTTPESVTYSSLETDDPLCWLRFAGEEIAQVRRDHEGGFRASPSIVRYAERLEWESVSWGRTRWHAVTALLRAITKREEADAECEPAGVAQAPSVGLGISPQVTDYLDSLDSGERA